jgi:ribosome maturation factor RimP
MKGPDRLVQLLEPVVNGLGYEMVGLEFDSHLRVLRVYIDQDDGVGLEDCTKVSHQLSGVLNVEDPIPGNYHLEVSSPGLDRPLFTLEHYRRFAGSLVRMQLLRPVDGRRRFKGRLMSADDGLIVIRQDDGVESRLPFEAIEKARVIPEFEQKNRKGR